MTLLSLLLSFVQIGALSIGGGYAAMPLIHSQAVTLHGWITMGEFADLVTIAEMTGAMAIWRRCSRSSPGCGLPSWR